MLFRNLALFYMTQAIIRHRNKEAGLKRGHVKRHVLTCCGFLLYLLQKCFEFFVVIATAEDDAYWMSRRREFCLYQ